MEHDTQKHVFFWVLSIGYIYLLRKASLFEGVWSICKDSRTENFDNYYPCRKKKLDCDLNHIYTGYHYPALFADNLNNNRLISYNKQSMNKQVKINRYNGSFIN